MSICILLFGCLGLVASCLALEELWILVRLLEVACFVGGLVVVSDPWWLPDGVSMLKSFWSLDHL